MIHRRRRLKIASLVLAWLALGGGPVGLPVSKGAHQVRAVEPILEHWCPDNGCPLDGDGCHYDERGRYHCH